MEKKRIYCTNCGNIMEENLNIAPIDNICSGCGVSDKLYTIGKNPRKWSFCRYCGNKLDKRAEKCPRCRNIVGPIKSSTIIYPVLASTPSNEAIEMMNGGR